MSISSISPSARPAFVFVPGALHTRFYLEDTISILETAGYTVRVAQHGTQIDPSAPPDAPVAQNWDPDVAAVRHQLSYLINEQGRNVVLVAHSYGGAPASEACKGYANEDREARGLKGGVIKLVWFSSLLLDVGNYCWEPSGGRSPFGANVVVDGEICYGDTSLVGDWFYPECPDQQRKEALVAALRPQAWKAFLSKATYAAWKDIDGVYVVLGADLTIPPIAQRGMLEMARGHRYEVVEMKGSDHTPFVSRTKEVIRILRKAAGEEGV